MSDLKKPRREDADRPCLLPPVNGAFQGDSVLNVGCDFQYATLQGLATYPDNVAGVQYEAVAQIPRKQGIDLRVFAMLTGNHEFSSTLGTGPNQFVVGLKNTGWQTMVQTAKANVTPVVATDQSKLVFDSVIVVAADNVANNGGGTGNQIVKGTMKSGIVQDFTQDLYNKIESSTIITKCKLQTNCLSRAKIARRVVTASSNMRTFSLYDSVFPLLNFSTSNSSWFIAAKWTSSYLDLLPSGTFGASVQQVLMKQDVPYGVLPHFTFGDNTLQIVHVLLRWMNKTTGVEIVFVPQPFESHGLPPPNYYDGTWLGAILYSSAGAVSPALLNLAGLSPQSIGLMRMFCPSSIPTVAFLGLSGNMLFANGNATSTAPAALPIQESYGAHPPAIEGAEAFVNTVQITYERAPGESDSIVFIS